MGTMTMKAREVPVVREVDVLVAGGGVAGFGAAMSAARNGAKVLLVEQQSANAVSTFHNQWNNNQ